MAPLTGYKVADLSELSAIAPEDRVSGYMRSVESEKSWYQFVEGDTSTELLPAVVEPNAGTGRWFKSNITTALEIPELDEYIQDTVAAFITAGSNITLVYDDVANTLSIALGSAGSFSSETIVYTTGSIAPGGYAVVPIVVPNFSHAYRIATNNPARVRLYTTENSALVDLSRNVSQELSGEHGCFLEVVTTSSNLDLMLAPTATLYRVSGETGIYLSCINTGTSPQSITTTLYIYTI